MYEKVFKFQSYLITKKNLNNAEQESVESQKSSSCKNYATLIVKARSG